MFCFVLKSLDFFCLLQIPARNRFFSRPDHVHIHFRFESVRVGCLFGQLVAIDAAWRRCCSLPLARGTRALSLSSRRLPRSPNRLLQICSFVFFRWDEYKRPIHNTIKEPLLCLHLSDLTADAFPNSPVPCCFGFNTRPTDIRNEGSLILYYSTTRLLRSKPMSLDLFEKKKP